MALSECAKGKCAGSQPRNDLCQVDQLTFDAARHGRTGAGMPHFSMKEHYKYQAYLQDALDDSDDDPVGSNAAHSQLQAAAMEHAKKMKADFAKGIRCMCTNDKCKARSGKE